MGGDGGKGGAAGGGKMGRKIFSVSPADYKLQEEVGYGASATVHRAIYLPTNEVIAVKCLDLDRCNSNLDDIRREAQTMSLIDHPNVIRAYCSFVVDKFLWVVMPFMAEGSCLHLMKIAYPDGFEEACICSILKETLKALEYLHRHGHIHRDIKAGNILLDSNGIVKLGDFGVSACMFDRGDRQRSRNTFVGTPCWMAPEVLQPGSGYDFKADIWSFGITALELAHGHAPFSKYPPMKVLLMTIQNAPPGLDYDRDKKFSKSFKEMVAMCLVKDQTRRPTAERLLKHSFFKNAKPPESSLRSLLVGLPPLWVRVKELQQKDAAQLALKKMPSAEQEALSQSEYQRGVSAWNFDVEDLKNQASLIQDDEDLPGIKEYNGCSRSLEKEPSVPRMRTVEDDIYKVESNGTERSESRISRTKDEIVEYSNLNSQTKVDGCEALKIKTDLTAKTRKEPVSSQSRGDVTDKSQAYSGPLMSTTVSKSPSERMRIHDRFDGENQVGAEKYKRDVRKVPSFSGPLMLPNRASANSLSAPTAPGRSSGGYRDTLDDKPKTNVVQIKGRFSVTSENVDIVKDIPICVPKRSSQSASVGDWFDPKQAAMSLYTQAMSLSPKDVANISIPASLIVPHLQNLLQQTSFQEDLIMNVLNSVQQTEQVDGTGSSGRGTDEEMPVELARTEREQLLLAKISELQSRITVLADELTAAKLKNLQLQQQLQVANSREEDDTNRREEKSMLSRE